MYNVYMSIIATIQCGSKEGLLTAKIQFPDMINVVGGTCACGNGVIVSRITELDIKPSRYSAHHQTTGLAVIVSAIEIITES